MRSSLRLRFLVLLLSVAAIALSAAILLRGFIIRDFRQYMDGEAQDRIQRVIAVIEGHHEQRAGWEPPVLAGDLVWALQMGLEARVYDAGGKPLLDTRRALEGLTPLMAKRVGDVSGYDPAAVAGEFVPYPLFLQGREIGRLEARPLHPVKEEYFISSSNRFLLYTLIALGTTALFLGVLAARRLSRPILELAAAAGEIAAGNLSRRVRVSGPDELVSLASSFNRMADAVEAQEGLRRRLVSSAAHELRTPLAIISGELEGMIDGVLPLSREGLSSMHDEARRLTAILNGVDDLTRAEAATVGLQREHLELKPFLGAIVGRFERLFAERRGVILLDCPEGLHLCADPDRLSQVVINLIANALKAIATGGRVTVVAASGDGLIRIEVADNGHGIAEADLPHLFERFYKGNGGGLGLGLAIVKELVAAHGGNVEVRSRVGEGTVFLVVLPQV